MLSAVLSPVSYQSHFLSESLYLMVAALAVGYGIALLVVDALDRSAVEEEASQTGPRPEMIALLARWRWYWIPPLYAVALLFLLIVTLTQGASTAQFMYRRF